MKKILLFTLIASCMAACGGPKALGWVSAQKSDIGWSVIEMRKDIQYEAAWDDVTSVLIRKFEPEMLNKETGYIRTKWNYRWTTNGKATKAYRVRLTLKMSESKKQIEMNAEAQKLKGKTWLIGYDTELLEVMKKDIAGVVGR